MDSELPENLYKQHKSISNQMMFRILGRSPSSATNNIYLLNNNILRCIIYDGGCRCCVESYCVIDIVFKDFTKKIENIDWGKYKDKRVLIKGCASVPIPTWAYLIITSRLTLHAKQIFFGEPCAAVEIFNKTSN